MKHHNQDLIEKVKKERAEGASVLDLSNKYNINRRIIYYWLKPYIPKSKKRISLYPYDFIKRIQNEVRNGIALPILAKKYNVPHSTAYAWCKDIIKELGYNRKNHYQADAYKVKDEQKEDQLKMILTEMHNIKEALEVNQTKGFFRRLFGR